MYWCSVSVNQFSKWSEHPASIVFTFWWLEVQPWNPSHNFISDLHFSFLHNLQLSHYLFWNVSFWYPSFTWVMTDFWSLYIRRHRIWPTCEPLCQIASSHSLTRTHIVYIVCDIYGKDRRYYYSTNYCRDQPKGLIRLGLRAAHYMWVGVAIFEFWHSLSTVNLVQQKI